MAKTEWNYLLRIMRRHPDQIPMERMGEYIQQLAKLIGEENKPTLKGIVKGSTMIRTNIPESRIPYVQHQLREAMTDENSKGWRAKSALSDMLGEDGIKEANLLDKNKNVVLSLLATAETPTPTVRIYQSGMIDGVVTGLVGADDTMHLYLRDYLDRDLKIIVRDEGIARSLLQHFRNSHVRVYMHGTWVRTERGWHPEAGKCTVDRYEVLDETPISEVFKSINEIEGNGWRDVEDPTAFWEDLRGITH